MQFAQTVVLSNQGVRKRFLTYWKTAIYEYQWLLDQHNVQQHRDPLEDQIQAPMEQPLIDEPSLLEVEQEPSLKEPKECVTYNINIPTTHS